MTFIGSCLGCGAVFKYPHVMPDPWQCECGSDACSVTTRPSPPDLINHPPHYTAHPSGVECITITEHMSFNLGNALKYLWRADEKGAPLADLRKAIWYIEREISKRERG